MAAKKNTMADFELTAGDEVQPADLTAWTFLSTHAQVFLSIARRPDVRMREVAEEIRITERAVQRIVKDLEAAGYLTRVRVRSPQPIRPAHRTPDAALPHRPPRGPRP